MPRLKYSLLAVVVALLSSPLVSTFQVSQTVTRAPWLLRSSCKGGHWSYDGGSSGPSPSGQRFMPFALDPSCAFPRLQATSVDILPLAGAHDLRSNEVVGGAETEYPNDGYAGGIAEYLLMPPIATRDHQIDIEFDLFFTVPGARHAYDWDRSLSGWQQAFPNARNLPSKYPWFSHILYTVAPYTPNAGTYLYAFARNRNVVITVLAETKAQWLGAVAQLQNDVGAVELASWTHVAHLIARHAFRTIKPPTTMVMVGKKTSWGLRLRRCRIAHKLSGSISSATAHGKFVVAVLSATNRGTSPTALGGDTTFSAEDGMGRTFSENSAAESAARDQLGLSTSTFDNIQPSFASDHVLVFEVPSDAADLALMATPAFSNNSPTALFPLCA